MSLNSTGQTPVSSCSGSEPLETKFQVVLFSLIIVISLVGNTLVVIVVKLNRSMHSVANYLICNMSISDLIITLVPMMWEVVSLQHYPDGTWPMGAFMCSFTYMCVYISVACSIYSLTMISFDRFFAVIFPLKRIITKRSLPFLLVAIWIISFAFASPTIYAQRLSTEGNKTYCMEVWRPPFDPKESPKHYTVVLFVGLYAIPLILMAGLYSAIAVKLWRRNIPGNQSMAADSRATKQKKKVIKILVCVILLFAICWFPIFYAQFMLYFEPSYLQCPSTFPQWLKFFAFFMQYLSSAINPFIYFVFSHSFRSGFKRAIWQRIFGAGLSRQPTRTTSFAMSILSRRTLPRMTISPSIPGYPDGIDNNVHISM